MDICLHIMTNKIDDILASKIALSVLRFLHMSARGATGREIASAVRYSPQAALQALNSLEQFNLVRTNKIGRANWYEINRQHWFLSEGLIPFWQKIDSWLNILGQYYLDNLEPSPIAIFVFGSVAKGTAKWGSDLDLLFIYDDHEFLRDRIDKILELGTMIFDKFGAHPSPQTVSLSQFKKEVKKGEGFMRNIFREGKSIAGLTPSEVIHYDSKKDKDIQS